MKTLTKKLSFSKMGYLILPVIAGVAITLQTAFSGKISTKIGSLETVVLIHAFGLILALMIYLIRGNADFKFVTDINILSVMAGAMGVLIVFFISKSFVVNGALVTIMISVVVQLVVSKIIDHFGLLGVDRNPINLVQVLSLLIIVSGVVLYQYNK